jgi:hypothetical protein
LCPKYQIPTMASRRRRNVGPCKGLAGMISAYTDKMRTVILTGLDIVKSISHTVDACKEFVAIQVCGKSSARGFE